MKYVYSLVVCLLLTAQISSAQVMRSRMKMLMGARFDISLVANDSLTAEQNIDSVIHEISRIEYLISDWIDTTQVSRINQMAGIRPVKVDQEVLELTLRAIHISEITGGAFDITFAAMERIWKFDGSMTKMPSKKVVKRAKSKVNYRNIIVDTANSTVFLKQKGMKIGFGALGEGYATDKCRDIMLSKGINAGFVNGSGDISTWGNQADGTPWAIGIRDPFNGADVYAIVPLQTGAVTTSGSYEKYAEIDGTRYAHIINPATGYPASGLISVTVFGPSAEMANAFSTSLMVLGKEKGLAFMKQYPDYKCIMITDWGEFITSENFDLTPYKVENK